MKEHKIYFTILGVLVLGILLGQIMETDKLEAREVPEKVTRLQKLVYQGFIISLASLFYVAGTEYHGLKKKLKDD